MRVLVMFVVHMRMFVRHCFVQMLVIVAFGEMKPEAYGHEGRGQP